MSIEIFAASILSSACTTIVWLSIVGKREKQLRKEIERYRRLSKDLEEAINLYSKATNTYELTGPRK